MKFTKSILPICLLAALGTNVLANEICTSLCSSCLNTIQSDSTCQKVDLLCKCIQTLDSVNSERTAIEIGKRKLIDEISSGCSKPACARNLTFENGRYISMEKGTSDLTLSELKSGIATAVQSNEKRTPKEISAITATLDSLVQARSVLSMAPMSAECTEHCNSCEPAATAGNVTPVDSASAVAAAAPVDSATVAIVQTPAIDSAAAIPADSASAAQPADSASTAGNITPVDSAAMAGNVTPVDSAATAGNVTTVDSASAVAAAAAPVDSATATQPLDSATAEKLAMCTEIETSCACSAHKENAAKIAALDSAIALKRAELDSVNKHKDDLLRKEFAREIADSAQGACKIQGKCMLGMTFLGKELVPIEMHRMQTSVEPVPDTVKNNISKVETVKNDSAAVAQNTCVQPANSDTAANKKLFYKGLEIVYGNFKENSFGYNKHDRLYNLDGDHGIEGAITYLLRWYYYDGGSISVGITTAYHYNKFSLDAEKDPTGKKMLEYQGLGFGIPVSFRLGAPVIPVFKPYVSETFLAQKPIFEIYHFNGFEEAINGKSSSNSKDPASNAFKNWKNIFHGINEWEYSAWLGFGAEIMRQFSVEYQMMLGNKRTGNAHKYHHDDAWRIVFGFTW